MYVLGGREAAQQVMALENDPHLSPHPPLDRLARLAQLFPQHAQGSVLHRAQGADEGEQSGLPAAGGTTEQHHLPRIQGQMKVMEHLTTLLATADVHGGEGILQGRLNEAMPDLGSFPSPHGKGWQASTTGHSNRPGGPPRQAELLKRMATQHHCAVLMVTHDPRILDVADRLLQMEDGRLSTAQALAAL